MLSNKEQKIFSTILDLNYDVKIEEIPSKKLELLIKLNKEKKKLRDSMGNDNYDKFMNMGTRMFAPKED